jgi:hypothetical protein
MNRMEECYNFITSNIENLSDIELKEILKIVSNTNCKITRNHNGIFLNLSKLNDDVVKEIYNYIQFCKKSNDELDYYEDIKNNLNTCNIIDENKVIQKENVDDFLYKDVIVSCKNRMSSTMKFYILKKKIIRISNSVDLTLKSDLQHDISI